MEQRVFKLIKEYPGSLEIGSTINEVFDQDGISSFMFKDMEFPLSHIKAFPEYWEQVETPEIAESIEVRFITNKGTKIFKSKETRKVEDGYIFIFSSGKAMSLILKEGEDINI